MGTLVVIPAGNPEVRPVPIPGWTTAESRGCDPKAHDLITGKVKRSLRAVEA